MKKRSNQGFTLIEVLLVVAIIAILAGIVILAINPTKQLADTRNTQRRSDVATILNAVYQYAIDNNGTFPSEIDSNTGGVQVLGTQNTACDGICGSNVSTVSCADMASKLVPKYIIEVPKDPKTGTTGITKYYINKDSGNRITVGACEPEEGATISVSR